MTGRRPQGGAPREDGLGLVEVLVAVGLMSIVFVVFGQSLVAADRVARVERLESESVDLLRTEIGRIEREVRWADQITAPAAPYTGSPPSAAGTTLTIRTYDGVGISYTVTYELRQAGGEAELHRTEAGAASSTKLAEHLVYDSTPFRFYPRQGGDRNGYLDLSLSVQMDTTRDARDVTTRIGLRNLP